MIVDAHAHWGPWFFSMETGSLALNSELMDRFDIGWQLVSAIEAITYDARAGNRSLERVLSADGADPRVFGLVTIDPRELGAAREDLQRLSRPRWVGVKIHTHYSANPISSAPMQAAVELATEFGLPVLVHTWGDDLLDLAALAARVPHSRLIAGHMGAGAWRRIPEAREISDRIWFEPCWSQPEANRIRWVLDQIGHGRLVFGTDATLIDPSVTLGAVEAAGLDPEEWDAVMRANAISLFDLPTP